MSRNNSFGSLILFVVLGLIIGGVLGECFGFLFGKLGELMNAGGYNNIVHNFFVKPFWALNTGSGSEMQPFVLDLYMIKISFGLALKLNVMSLVGLAAGLYIMKWSGER